MHWVFFFCNNSWNFNSLIYLKIFENWIGTTTVTRIFLTQKQKHHPKVFILSGFEKKIMHVLFSPHILNFFIFSSSILLLFFLFWFFFVRGFITNIHQDQTHEEQKKKVCKSFHVFKGLGVLFTCCFVKLLDQVLDLLDYLWKCYFFSPFS